jgi:hypothetical protein
MSFECVNILLSLMRKFQNLSYAYKFIFPFLNFSYAQKCLSFLTSLVGKVIPKHFRYHLVIPSREV